MNTSDLELRLSKIESLLNGSSNQENTELAEKIECISEQNKIYLNDIQKLRDSNESLNIEIDQLKNKRSDLENTIQQYEKSLSEFKVQNETLTESLSKYIQSIDVLQKENNTLLNINTKLEEEITNLTGFQKATLDLNKSIQSTTITKEIFSLFEDALYQLESQITEYREVVDCYQSLKFVTYSELEEAKTLLTNQEIELKELKEEVLINKNNEKILLSGIQSLKDRLEIAETLNKDLIEQMDNM